MIVGSIHKIEAVVALKGWIFEMIYWSYSSYMNLFSNVWMICTSSSRTPSSSTCILIQMWTLHFEQPIFSILQSRIGKNAHSTFGLCLLSIIDKVCKHILITHLHSSLHYAASIDYTINYLDALLKSHSRTLGWRNHFPFRPHSTYYTTCMYTIYNSIFVLMQQIAAISIQYLWWWWRCVNRNRLIRSWNIENSVAYEST